MLEARELREIVLPLSLSGNLRQSFVCGKTHAEKTKPQLFCVFKRANKATSVFPSLFYALKRSKGMRAKLPCNIRVLANIILLIFVAVCFYGNLLSSATFQTARRSVD